jgi:hypothetical protein
MSEPLRADKDIDQIGKNSSRDAGGENVIPAYHSISQIRVYPTAAAKKASPTPRKTTSSICYLHVGGQNTDAGIWVRYPIAGRKI